MKLLEDIKFWILLLFFIILVIPITVYYWFYVNVIHKDLADEEEWFYDY
jgi:hypothetical protein